MMLWAVVSALTALSKDFVGLLLTRFFLGVTEAPFYPGESTSPPLSFWPKH
jgi:MFS transporter, ACS family, DAL5 transporter family protein